jgi:glycosyltransferase involved in cell wall biosynthesis
MSPPADPTDARFGVVVFAPSSAVDEMRTDAASAAGTETNVAAPTAAKTIRVLHVINGEHYSGAERVQDLLARQLPQFGFQVSFACVKPGRFAIARETTTATLIETPMRGRFDLRVVGKLVQLIRDGIRGEGGYELVHAHTPRTALVGRLAARRAGVPFVYHVHSPAGRDSTRRAIDWLNAQVERFSLRDADRIVAVSPSLREYMVARGFPAERVVCVPNGVPQPAGIGSGERHAPTGTWTLGTVALFRPRKGIEVLVEALAAIRSWGVDVRLRAVGGFETLAYETAILGRAERLGVADMIEWVGFTRDINAELAKIDLFVLPSLFGEGLPMVVLESMAAGVPIIASRVEGVPEAVLHRETGLLVEPGSVSQLATTIKSFVNGEVDYSALSRRGRERHAERFSDVAMARNLAEVYRDVLAGHTGALVKHLD